jgi:hypothetical protein
MKIFISYRRDDSGGHAGRLFDHLTARFGTQQIFMDVDTIQPGADFRKAIENAVGSCDVAVVMIGRQWLNIPDAQGKRRLDDPRDFVRAEVASALANPTVQVIPVLVRGASMPSVNDLPDDLKDLAWRNAIELSDSRFQYDANKLIGAIEKLGSEPIKKTEVGGVRKVGPLLLGGLFLGITALGLIFWMARSGPMGGTSTPTPSNVPVSTSTNEPATSIPTLEPATPSATENALPTAVQTLDQYFGYINDAGIPDDLRAAWDLLTPTLQCNPSDQCNFVHYRDFWWQFQVQYKLYDCDANVVTAELIYYSRGGQPNPSRSPAYVTYELLNENSQLKLESAKKATGVSAFCELAVSVP